MLPVRLLLLREGALGDADRVDRVGDEAALREQHARLAAKSVGQARFR